MSHKIHTPAPWILDTSNLENQGHIYIRPKGQGFLLALIDKHACQTHPDAYQANAEFIVKACNEHAELRKTLETIAKMHCVYHKGDVACDETDVTQDKYCGPCLARAVINSLEKP